MHKLLLCTSTAHLIINFQTHNTAAWWEIMIKNSLADYFLWLCCNIRLLILRNRQVSTCAVTTRQTTLAGNDWKKTTCLTQMFIALVAVKLKQSISLNRKRKIYFKTFILFPHK